MVITNVLVHYFVLFIYLCVCVCLFIYLCSCICMCVFTFFLRLKPKHWPHPPRMCVFFNQVSRRMPTRPFGLISTKTRRRESSRTSTRGGTGRLKSRATGTSAPIFSESAPCALCLQTGHQISLLSLPFLRKLDICLNFHICLFSKTLENPTIPITPPATAPNPNPAHRKYQRGVEDRAPCPLCDFLLTSLISVSVNVSKGKGRVFRRGVAYRGVTYPGWL